MPIVSYGIVRSQIGKLGGNLEAEVSKLKTLGIPTEPEDLSKLQTVSVAENAAPIYKQIAAEQQRLKTISRKPYSEMLTAYTGHPRDLAAFKETLDFYSKVLALAEELPDKSGFDMSHDYSKGFNLLFPEYAEMKGLSKLLSAKTRYHLTRKEFRQALNCIDIQYSIADHLSMEPTLIGALVGVACHAIATANLDLFLESVQDSPEVLAETESMLQRHQRLPSMRRALYGELVMGRIGLRSLRSWKEVENFGVPVEENAWDRMVDRFTLSDPAVRRMFEAKLVGAYRQLFETLPKDDRDWAGIRKAMKDHDAGIAADKSLDNVLNQILFPVFSQASDAFAKADAEKRVSMIAVKLLRMRNSEGLPKDLSRLGQLAMDPLNSNKPMGYVRKGNGFKVWSVGPDLHDDGGRKRGPSVQYKDTDVVLGYRIGFPPPTVKAAFPIGWPLGGPLKAEPVRIE
jgi:hypothetical protein